MFNVYVTIKIIQETNTIGNTIYFAFSLYLLYTLHLCAYIVYFFKVIIINVRYYPDILIINNSFY